ncbi:hypothetical protein DICVIV_02871 [Dictyocaulus viviparus]|uniref:Uncharacterized protein n=1 Tax=Dictyocaulus viviparus TaxID=29172 RepID=A0A0D8Y2B1_DICVI|nr:hypothetical protein DICVIV_02871 [Dictyocaulus viviparus]
MTIARKTWSRRFKIFTICQEAPMRAAVEDLANLMGSFFVDVDMVFSDVAAGLFLVAHSSTNTYPPLIPLCTGWQPWMAVENALHFQYFSSCVYGWPTYLLHNCGLRSVCRLVQKLQCCGKFPCDQVMIIEDNCCLCNMAAITLSIEHRNIDVFFASFRNGLYEVPFVVFADHETHSIVISIRGSRSLVDLVTDLCLGCLFVKLCVPVMIAKLDCYFLWFLVKNELFLTLKPNRIF